MINEGLIKTHELSKCKNIIERESSKLNYWCIVEFDYNNNTFILSYDVLLTENDLEYLFHVYNVLGFYLSYFELERENISRIFPWKDFKSYEVESNKNDKIKLFFESRFDKKLQYTPNKLYHVTNIENVGKIKKKGLCPSFFEKGDWTRSIVFFY